MLLLAGCGGGYGFQEAPAAAMPPAPQQPMQASGYPPAGGYERPADSWDAPPPAYDGPGASYAAPGAGYAPPAQQAYPAYQPPAQDYSQPPQGWQDPAAGAAGPAGSSQRAAGEVRYDEVGYAGVRGVAGGDPSGNAIVAVHRSLPAGTIVEVTSLDTAKTILVLITGSAETGGNVVDLSPGAARLLGGGASGLLPVRVRKVITSPGDAVALREGRPASERPDTPPVLLSALRKHLPAAPAYSPSYPPAQAYAPPSAPAYSQPAYRPQPAPQRPAAAPVRGGFIVQVAALSNSARAQSIATSLGGFVKPGGGLYRIQIGPFRSAGEAEAARARAAKAGYGDARVFSQ
ncbi:SPOR domain-containing protein [Sphingomonas canadensis]|uniref:SPOR domain-containing protein n=2 Tax=Sphingomonas canadensis TaxID=1219257 RepID=A0ABW3HBP6_9SPHN